jgi:Calx-beta domain
MTFPVTLSQPATAAVSVTYSVVGGTATVGGSATTADVKTKTGVVNFPLLSSGKTAISKTITVTGFTDVASEPDETFTVVLSAPTGGFALGRAVGVGTLLDDDPPSGTTMGIGDGSIVQQSLGSQSVKLPITLSHKVPTPVTVTYTVTPATAPYSTKATGGGEFGGKLTGTVTFSANALVRTVSWPVWPDLVPDDDHTFTVTLSNVTPGVTIARPTGTVTLLDG